MKHFAVLMVILSLSVVACTSGDGDATPVPSATGVISDPDPLSVGGLVDSNIAGETLVVGFVVVDSNGARLCAALAESLPPLCSGASVDLVDLEDLKLTLQEAQGVRWTDSAVVFRGLYEAGTLTVTQIVGS